MVERTLIERLNVPWPEHEVEEVTLPAWILELCAEAANALTGLEVENARLQREADNWLTLIAAERQKTDTAEARLAEALKALEPFASVALLDQTPDAPRGMWVSVPFGWLQDARRAREGGKIDG